MIGSRVAGTDLAQDRWDQIVGTGSNVPQVGACSGPHARRCAGLRRGAIDPTCGIRRRREFSDQRRALWSRRIPASSAIPAASAMRRACLGLAQTRQCPHPGSIPDPVDCPGPRCPMPADPSASPALIGWRRAGASSATATVHVSATSPAYAAAADLARVAGTRRDMCFSSAEPIALPRHPSAAAFSLGSLASMSDRRWRWVKLARQRSQQRL